MENKRNIFKNIDAVIFDFDGTLYDKNRFAFRLVFNNLKDIFLIRAERKTRYLLKGKDFNSADIFYKNFFKQMSSVLNNKKYSPDYLQKWYFKCYLPMLTNTLKKYCKARDRASELFDYLNKSNIKIAVFSDYSAVSERMKAIGLYSTICSLYSSEELGALKPCPRPFLEIADKLQVSPTKTLVIGDREDTDGAGATKAGMEFFWLNNMITWKENLSNF